MTAKTSNGGGKRTSKGKGKRTSNGKGKRTSNGEGNSRFLGCDTHGETVSIFGRNDGID